MAKKFRREWDGETVRVMLPALPALGWEAEEWVDLKARLSRADEIALERSARKGISLVNGQAEADIEVFLQAAKTARLAVAVTGWSFDEPLRDFELLEEPWLELLNTRMDELYELTPEQEKNSGGAPTPQS